jgi:hypothetical protein
MAARTLVQWCELRHLISENLAVDVVAQAWRGIAVDVVQIILCVIPREDLEEGAQRGDISPRGAGGDGAPRRLVSIKVLQF